MGKLITVYSYDPEKFYFRGTRTAQQDSHGISFPPHTTDIPPPPTKYTEVAVFNVQSNSWTKIKDPENKIFKQVKAIAIKGVYSGQITCIEQSIPYIVQEFNSSNLGDRIFTNLLGFSYNANCLRRFFNPYQIGLGFIARLTRLNQKISNVYKKSRENYHAITSRTKFLSITDNRDLSFECEEIIYHMKKVLDFVISSLSLSPYKEQLFDIDSKIPLDSVGSLLKPKRNTDPEIINTVKSLVNFDKFSDLFFFINEINNSFKHHVVSQSTPNIFYFNPHINTHRFQEQAKNLRTLLEYDADLIDIIQGFYDFIYFVFNLGTTETEGRFNLIYGNCTIPYTTLTNYFSILNARKNVP